MTVYALLALVLISMPSLLAVIAPMVLKLAIADCIPSEGERGGGFYLWAFALPVWTTLTTTELVTPHLFALPFRIVLGVGAVGLIVPIILWITRRKRLLRGSSSNAGSVTAGQPRWCVCAAWFLVATLALIGVWQLLTELPIKGPVGRFLDRAALPFVTVPPPIPIVDEFDGSDLDLRWWEPSLNVPAPRDARLTVSFTGPQSAKEESFPIQFSELTEPHKYIEVVAYIPDFPGEGNASVGLNGEFAHRRRFAFNLNTLGEARLGYHDSEQNWTNLDPQTFRQRRSWVLKCQFKNDKIVFYVNGRKYRHHIPNPRSDPLGSAGLGRDARLELLASKGESITVAFDRIEWGIVYE